MNGSAFDDRFRRVAIGLALAIVGACGVSPVAADSPPPQAYVNSIGMKMLPVPAGTFQMGNRHAGPDQWDEEPAHRVTISRPLFISEAEVTIAQYQSFHPGVCGSLREKPSVTGISWHDAVAFCAWAEPERGQTLSPADRSGMGILRPRRNRNTLLVGRGTPTTGGGQPLGTETRPQRRPRMGA